MHHRIQKACRSIFGVKTGLLSTKMLYIFKYLLTNINRIEWSDPDNMTMRVFWENGYAGTSLAQLTTALGINKPSLYAAFGNKERLFATAMEHYMDRYAAPALHRLTDPPDVPLKGRLRAYLFGIIDVISDCESPKGCMFVKSSCESGGVAIPGEITASLQDMGMANEMALSHLLETERLNGWLPEDTQVQDTASFLLSVTYGLSVLARRGKTKEELKAVAEMAVSALPGIG
jgi:AcrR family transcriptional regulator